MPRLVIQHSDPHVNHITEGSDGHLAVRGYVSSVKLFRWALSDHLPRLRGHERAAAEKLWRLAGIVTNVPAGVLLELAQGSASIEYDRENDKVIINHHQAEDDDGERGVEAGRSRDFELV